MIHAGYLTNRMTGLCGARGQYYDYIMAGNGLFIESEGTFLAARVQISSVLVRGLAALAPKLVLRYGKVPGSLFQLALNILLTDTSKEKYIAVIWKEGNYHLVSPEQESSEAKVKYANPESVILDLHSHPRIPAFFSSTDNLDEQGFRLYGVVGQLENPELALRVGVYGYFNDIEYSDVFEGTLTGATETAKKDEPDV